MKNKILWLASLALATGGSGFMFTADAQFRPYRGIGPVTAVSQTNSQLPQKALKFIEDMGGTISTVEKDFNPVEYDVVLTSGIEIDFDSNGNVKDIDAPGSSVFGDDIVKRVIPAKAFGHLKQAGAEMSVQSISRTRNGWDVEFTPTTINGRLYNEARFDHKGALITMGYDD